MGACRPVLGWLGLISLMTHASLGKGGRGIPGAGGGGIVIELNGPAGGITWPAGQAWAGLGVHLRADDARNPP
jgi:hypothetical protein